MKTRVLAIVPYNGLQILVERVASDMEDVEVTAVTKNLEEAALWINSVDLQHYDIILSRGGTTRLLEKIVSIPVIDILLSGTDILSAIRSASLFSKRFAIVGFPAIIRSARFVVDVIQEQVNLFTIESEDEVRALIHKLKEQGYNTIVGDVITVACAQETQLNGVLFYSSEESVHLALSQAIKLRQVERLCSDNNELLHTIIFSCESQFFLFDAEGQLLYCAGEGDYPDNFPQCLAQHIPAVVQNGKVSLYLSVKNGRFPVTGKAILYRSRRCVLFRIQPMIPLSPGEDLWISTNLASESYIPPLSFQSSQSPLMNSFISQLNLHAKIKQPLLLIGEDGTGKDFVINTLHAQSEYRKNTLVTLDSRFTTPKCFSTLFSSTNSVLCHAGISIYFKNTEMLDSSVKLQLIEYIHQTLLYSRNQLYFSWELPSGGSIPLNDPLYIYLTDELNCSTLVIPPLRQHPEDILTLAGLLLNNISLQYGKQVIGFTAEALKLLQTAAWPRNLCDLEQLLIKAVALTDTSHITQDTIYHLFNASSQPSTASSVGSVPLTGTLYEITQHVIRAVLTEEKNNQARTAQRLGISRGTLWKRIKEIEGD